jgi:hypothetical protein
MKQLERMANAYPHQKPFSPDGQGDMKSMTIRKRKPGAKMMKRNVMCTVPGGQYASGRLNRVGALKEKLKIVSLAGQPPFQM